MVSFRIDLRLPHHWMLFSALKILNWFVEARLMIDFVVSPDPDLLTYAYAPVVAPLAAAVVVSPNSHRMYHFPNHLLNKPQTKILLILQRLRRQHRSHKPRSPVDLAGEMGLSRCE